MRFAAPAPLHGVTAAAVAGVVARAWHVYGGPPGAVLEVALLPGAAHTELHARHLHDPAPTDVMAFPYHEPDLYGEILVNRDFARAQARARRCPPAQEALLYVAHGALHLLGFRDDSAAAAAQMRAAEARVLAARRPARPRKKARRA